MAVVAVLGLLAAMATTRFGHETLGVTDASGVARRAALALTRTKRQAVCNGADAALVLQRSGGAVTGMSVVRVGPSGDEPTEASIDIPSGVVVTSPVDRWQFDYTGVPVSPVAGGTMTIVGGGKSWAVTVYAASGHVRCQSH